MLKLIKLQFVNLASIAAILTGSLAPTLAQAKPSESVNKSFTAVICSSSGANFTHTIELSSKGADSYTAANHCPYCVLSNDGLVFINSELTFTDPQDQSQFLSLFYKSPTLITSWISLPSRAPPKEAFVI